MKNLFMLIILLLWLLPFEYVAAENEKEMSKTKTMNATSAAAEDDDADDEDDEPKLAIYNANFTAKLDQSFDGGDFNIFHARSLLSKLGKIALFLRLYRSWTYSPVTGHHGFFRYFPQPSVPFHRQIYGNCSTPNVTGFINCVNIIFADIQQRAKFMFPLKDQKTDEDFYQIEEVDFTRRISNTKFNFDISASYLFCFLTKTRLSIMERLPFCGYGFEAHQNIQWPAVPFRQYADSPELWPNGTKSSDELDPIDEIWDQVEFQCADVSFCPDPCCGRNSTRFFNASRKTSATDGWCPQSPCSSLGVRHLNREAVQRHLDEQKRWEDARNKSKNVEENVEIAGGENEEANGDGNNGTAGNATRLKSDDISEESSTVNTHYCYLEEAFNDDFLGIMENLWNLTCACAFPDGTIDRTKIYRFDVRECVDLDECIYTECEDGKQCVNQADDAGYRCECPLGQYRETERPDSACLKIPLDDDKLPKNLLLY